MGSKVYRVKHITRDFMDHSRETMFLFGDNMARKGMGGQAKEMRGHVRAIGVPTKWFPGMSETALFGPKVLDNPMVKAAIDEAFALARQALDIGMDVVIPTDGIGTGYARLQEKSPRTLEYINAKLDELQSLYPSR